jgi:outer membrane protein assembly factor BamD (BamD/ComL family)/heme/copper-type cytochrome/quinol oxidase subunit 4
LLALAGKPAEGGSAAMHGTFNLVVGILGLVVVISLIGIAIFLVVKKDYDPAKVIFKLLSSVALIVAVCFFVHHMAARLEGGVSFANFGTALMIAGSIVVGAIILSITWTPYVSEWVASPLSSIFDGGREPPEPKPFYSIAMAKRNRGKPREAIMEIRRQLEKFPNDFEGVMLLARMQAEDLADLAAAETTLNHFCDWPGALLKQVVAACSQLADWHLKSADADAARAALQKIITRFPDTESALQAEQRIAHLSEAEKMFLAQQDKNIVLPAGVQNVGLLDSTEFLKPQQIEPGHLAAAHVKHLEAHPHDTEVREKLALIYARDFKRLDLATMELAQMINEPRHPAKQVAHWLNLLADFQVELGADAATVQATLGKIVERFPNLPLADLAQRRLARLENEFKGLRQPIRVKLGTYEQNIGLKYGTPRKPE